MPSQSVYLLRYKSCFPSRFEVNKVYHIVLKTGYFVIRLLNWMLGFFLKITLRKGWNKIMYLRVCCKLWSTSEAGCVIQRELLALNVPLASCLLGAFSPASRPVNAPEARNGKVCETNWPLTRIPWLNISRIQPDRAEKETLDQDCYSGFLQKPPFQITYIAIPRKVLIASSAAHGVRMLGCRREKRSTNLQWRRLDYVVASLWNLSDELVLRDHLKQLFSQCPGAGLWGEHILGRPEWTPRQPTLFCLCAFNGNAIMDLTLRNLLKFHT